MFMKKFIFLMEGWSSITSDEGVDNYSESEIEEPIQSNENTVASFNMFSANHQNNIQTTENIPELIQSNIKNIT